MNKFLTKYFCLASCNKNNFTNLLLHLETKTAAERRAIVSGVGVRKRALSLN